MTVRPVVAVTATSEIIHGALRVRLNAAYPRALEGAGLVPLVVPPLAEPAQAARVLAAVDGLVLSGGEDVDPTRYGAPRHPACGEPHAGRDATELALVEAARARRVPTLAICRGVQLLNVALGGTLVQDLPTERPSRIRHEAGGERGARTHDVAVNDGSLLAAAVGATCLTVNSFHHQALDRIAPPLRVTARASDGVIEGVESDDPERWWTLGVQWHPEELVDDGREWDRGLFRAFAERLAGRK
ncbi:MAG: gamma-glutamyl-gamma-aminobutyrate hydrolase family protein [Gemmatimonadaceae bacterium]